MSRLAVIASLLAGCYQPSKPCAQEGTCALTGDGLPDGSMPPDMLTLGDAPAGAPCAGAMGHLLGEICRDPSTTLSIVSGETLNTTDDPRCDPTATTICLVAATSIGISAKLDVIGARPLVLWSATTIEVTGIIDASSRREGPARLGPAANFSECEDVHGDQSGTAPLIGTGGGGGGFGTAGGRGGDAANNNEVVMGDQISASKPLALHGGCPGGVGGVTLNTSAGAGGGAVYLMARTMIRVTGAITASGGAGGGGNGAAMAAGGGSGGGSGGLIGLDAPTIELDGAALSALGGGGGSGGKSAGGVGTPGTAGADPGVDPPAQAFGALQTATQNNGGVGSSLDGSAGGDGGNAATTAQMAGTGGGGGGGGAGYIKFYGTRTDLNPSLIAPPAI